ncbi:hypothetical protein DQ04_05931000, partial [Trypanosoma grayi]|uniref:hypothetical protein n=1 Tax=Trypanosoma grayi TaxID=71804 RepID=UPI0004F4AA4F
MGDTASAVRLRVSFARRDANSMMVSPLSPRHSHIGEQETRSLHGERESNHNNPVVVIDPKKISDFQRFRFIFVGMLLLINTSTQGLHALFGVYIETIHRYDIRTMVDIFAAGTAFGLFVFPFGAMYDFFGPRIVFAIATVITSLSHLLFALTFSGHIDPSKTRYSVYFAMMNWGCYAFDVAALPTVLTYAPRDRAHPIGMLKTFSGLGPSIISCIFRGFFNDRYDNLMYFLMTIVLVFGVIGTVFLDNAPYEVTRWKERHITLKEKLSLLLVRNRYMSQLLPKRRFHIMSVILVILNVYLTTQSICAAYYKDSMTKGRYRGLAIGAIVIVLFIFILLVPLHQLDGPTAQDQAVIEKAREVENHLAEERRKRHAKSHGRRASSPTDPRSGMDGHYEETTSVEAIPANYADVQSALGTVPVQSTDSIEMMRDTEDEKIEERSQHHPYQPVDPDASLIEAIDLIPLEEDGEEEHGDTAHWLRNTSLAVRKRHSELASTVDTAEMEVVTRGVSTYDHPYVETITVCGEVFVTPIYETSFLQSLTYIDLWLLFYTTFVVWGVGMTMTGNWNIRVMVGSRYTQLEYKTYVLFATMSGVSTAFGRVIIGLYEVLLLYVGQRMGVSLPATIGFPIPSILLTLALIFYLAFPDNLSLIVVYLVAPFAYGFSGSITIYVIGIIFKRDIGMHYGFCILGAALGIVLFYRLLFFGVYDRHKLVFPPNGPQ